MEETDTARLKTLPGQTNSEKENGENGTVADETSTEEETPNVSRLSRVNPNPRGQRKTVRPDTDIMRENLNELRDRFASNVQVQGGMVENQNAPEELVIGDLHLVIISDTEIKYTNTNMDNAPTEEMGVVKVTVGYKTFEIHKNILAQSSGFFKSKFEADPKANSVTLDSNIGVNGFTSTLDFLYDGSGIINVRIAETVFETTVILDIDWIRKSAVDFLLRHIYQNNYRSVQDLFRKYNFEKEANKINNIVAQKLVEFSHDPNFVKTLQFDFLKKVLAENYFVDGTEGFIVKTILDWINVDPKRRERRTALLKLVRLPLLEPEELLAMPELFKDIPGYTKEIDNAMEYVCNVSGQYKYEDDIYLARGYRSVLTLLSATEANNGGVIMYKDLENMDEPMCLENLHPRGLEVTLAYMTQATLGNFIYSAGGLDENYAISNQLFRYDPRIRDWQQLASMNDNRMSFALVSSSNRLFAVGGESYSETGRETILNSAEQYDPENNTWTKMKPIPSARVDCAGVYEKGKIYISGGAESKRQNTLIFNDLYYGDVGVSLSWIKLPDMPRARVEHSMSHVNGKLYILGGLYKHDTDVLKECLEVDVYDIDSKTWTTVDPLPAEVMSVNKNVAVIGDSVAFMGNSRWWLYDTLNSSTTLGEYSGCHVNTAFHLKVAYPPVEH